MIADVILPLVRRAILDLLADIGGENNNVDIALLLAELGHRVARHDVAEQLLWLAERGLVHAQIVGSFVVARATSEGVDVAGGSHRVDGVSRHKTGE